MRPVHDMASDLHLVVKVQLIKTREEDSVHGGERLEEEGWVGRFVGVGKSEPNFGGYTPAL